MAEQFNPGTVAERYRICNALLLLCCIRLTLQIPPPPPPLLGIWAYKGGVATSAMAIRVHCATWDEVDYVWQAIALVPDDQFQPVELHLDSFGPLYAVVRQGGVQTTARLAAQPARTRRPLRS